MDSDISLDPSRAVLVYAPHADQAPLPVVVAPAGVLAGCCVCAGQCHAVVYRVGNRLQPTIVQ